MSKLKSIRELQNLTQEELAKQSGVSVRTIQRIETGKEPKGYTLRILAKALAVAESQLQTQEMEAANTTVIEEKEKIEEAILINYSTLKLINLSSIPFIILPPFNIIVPLILMITMKQKNTFTKQLISVQILWTILAPIVFMLGIFLKLGRQFTLILMILIALSNVFIILRNALEIDRNKKLHYKLKFSLL
ncbi:helix-turn-helix domain-containing protein [Flavobacterium sp. WC2430]|uniref:helix-turn-helix domain-containing protein n=1 Tax=Flavobacterium sp. WC2430 TaxID=3234137 RepID=UPI0034651D3E